MKVVELGVDGREDLLECQPASGQVTASWGILTEMAALACLGTSWDQVTRN